MEISKQPDDSGTYRCPACTAKIGAGGYCEYCDHEWRLANAE